LLQNKCELSIIYLIPAQIHADERELFIIRQDITVITNYVDDGTVPLDDRGAPWQDIAKAAGVILPKTIHFKPLGSRTVQPQTIQRACKADRDIINAICEEEKELTEDQAKARRIWCSDQLKTRPHSKDWKDTAVCDEFYFGIGQEKIKRLKRLKGRKHRYKPENVHRKKGVTRKDIKVKAWEEGHEKLFNIFVIIGYNYRKIVLYEVPNKVGKMTAKVYIEVILPAIKDDLLSQGLTLVQDADSAHICRATTSWAQKHGLSLLTLPGVSPDLSILESMANPIKRRFHARRCTTDQGALKRFTGIFNDELDQKTIQHCYDYYIKRLWDCKRARGQMTSY
jgi:hypothetical protein